MSNRAIDTTINADNIITIDELQRTFRAFKRKWKKKLTGSLLLSFYKKYIYFQKWIPMYCLDATYDMHANDMGRYGKAFEMVLGLNHDFSDYKADIQSDHTELKTSSDSYEYLTFFSLVPTRGVVETFILNEKDEWVSSGKTEENNLNNRLSVLLSEIEAINSFKGTTSLKYNVNPQGQVHKINGSVDDVVYVKKDETNNKTYFIIKSTFVFLEQGKKYEVYCIYDYDEPSTKIKNLKSAISDKITKIFYFDVQKRDAVTKYSVDVFRKYPLLKTDNSSGETQNIQALAFFRYTNLKIFEKNSVDELVAKFIEMVNNKTEKSIIITYKTDVKGNVTCVFSIKKEYLPELYGNENKPSIMPGKEIMV